MSKVYNATEDNWTFCSDSTDVVIEDVLSDLTQGEIDNIEILTIYEGVKNPFTFNDLLDVDTIIEDMQTRAYDNVSEHADDYLADVTSEQKEELRLLINGWAEKHEIEPNFFLVENMKEIKVKVTDEMKRG